VRYVKVETSDFEAQSTSVGQAGPDIDAVAAIHSAPEEPPAVPVPALPGALLVATGLLLAGFARAPMRQRGARR
jgi:hypothetical protein